MPAPVKPSRYWIVLLLVFVSAGILALASEACCVHGGSGIKPPEPTNAIWGSISTNPETEPLHGALIEITANEVSLLACTFQGELEESRCLEHSTNLTETHSVETFPYYFTELCDLITQMDNGDCILDQPLTLSITITYTDGITAQTYNQQLEHTITPDAFNSDGEIRVDIVLEPTWETVQPGFASDGFSGAAIDCNSVVQLSHEGCVRRRAAATVYYVDADATGAATGLSWTNAFTDLQSALAVATSGDEIWIAEGVYKPTSGVSTSMVRSLAHRPNYSSVLERIAFDTDQIVANGQIYIIDADGSNEVQLTNSSGTNHTASISPSRDKILFVSTRDGNSEIYIMDIDGSNPINLSNHSGSDGEPRWSPDGERIVFGSDRNGNSDIFIMDIDGSNLIQLTSGSEHDYTPTWHPDGEKITYTRDQTIYTMDIDGSNKVPLCVPSVQGGSLAWSPDGSKLAFVTHGSFPDQAAVMNSDCSNINVLTNGEDVDGLTWSLTGAYLLFDAGNNNATNNIYALSIDRTATFELPEGITIYGGFNGSETLFSQRNPNLYQSILSGDILDDDSDSVTTDNSTRDDNSYHTISANDLSADVTLDGVVIRAGNANSVGGGGAREGGGIRCINSNIKILDVEVSRNSASNSGGGIYGNGCAMEIADSVIENNTAHSGGGIAAAGLGNVKITNTLVTTNEAHNGGGIFVSSGDFYITHAIVSTNTATSLGGGMNLSVTGDNDCLISDTSVIGNRSDTSAGGIHIHSHSNCTIVDSTILSNHAEFRGGGLYAYRPNLTITNTKILSNTAGDRGGGIATHEWSDEDSYLSIFTSQIAHNSTGGTGGGIYNINWITLTVENTIVEYNSALGNGGGAYNYRSDAMLNGVEFSNNVSGGTGGGLYCVSHSPNKTQGHNTAFLGNQASLGGAVTAYNCSIEFYNPLLSGNYSGGNGAGAYIQNGSRATFVNATIAGNYTGGSGSIYTIRSSTHISNSIIWNNNQAIRNDTDAETTVTYSIVQGGYPGPFNENVDPRFISPVDSSQAPSDSGNGQLQLTSPAIDSGNNDVLPANITSDLAGNLRRIDVPSIMDTGAGAAPIIDRGAYEVPSQIILYVNINAPDGGDGYSWATALNRLDYAIARSTSETEIWVSAGVYPASNGSFSLTGNVKLYGGFAGWETAREQRDWQGNPTILSGENTRTVVSASTDANSILDGFYVRDGAAREGGGMSIKKAKDILIRNVTFEGNVAESKGGGVYISGTIPETASVKFVNVEFKDNSSFHGGGVYNVNTNMIFINCTFRGNYASNIETSGGNGGGIYHTSGNPLIINTVFSGNYAGGHGGGLYHQIGLSLVVNSTFSGNRAASRGGMSGGFAHNSIFWGNRDDDGVNGESQVGGTVTYSVVQGGLNGVGNIDSDPQFVTLIDAWFAPTTDGDLRLKDTSPARDAGSNTAVYTDVLDLDGDNNILEAIPFDRDGNLRFTDSAQPDTGEGNAPIVDMGAFEWVISNTQTISGAVSSQVVSVTGQGTVADISFVSTVPNNTSMCFDLLDTNGQVIEGYECIPLADGNSTQSIQEVGTDFRIRVRLNGSTDTASPKLLNWTVHKQSDAVGRHILTGELKDGHGHALKDAEVVVFADGVLVASGQTNRIGIYEIPFTPVANAFYTAQAKLKHADNWFTIGYQDPNNTNAVYLESESFQIDTDSLVINSNLHFDFDYHAQNGYKSNVDEPTRLSDMASMYVHTYEMIEYIRNMLEVILDPIQVHAFVPGVGSALFEAYDGYSTLVVGEAFSHYDVGSRPMNREYHEIAHALMADTFGIPESSCEPNENHGGSNNCQSVDSFVEGWAIYWTTAFRKHQGWQRYDRYFMGWRNIIGTALSIEYNYASWDDVCKRTQCASLEEFAAAGVFFDLTDGDHSGYSDEEVEITEPRLLSVLRNAAPSTMLDVYFALKDAQIGDQASTLGICEDMTQLDDIFVMHGFFEDANEDRAYQCGEVIGDRKEHPARAESSEIANTTPVMALLIDIDLDLPSILDQRIYESLDSSAQVSMTVDVCVHDPVYGCSPVESHSYDIVLPNISDNRVLIVPPPTRTLATVTLSLNTDGVRAPVIEPLIIKNVKFWNIVKNMDVEDSIVQEHTFREITSAVTLQKLVADKIESLVLVLFVCLIMVSAFVWRRSQRRFNR